MVLSLLWSSSMLAYDVSDQLSLGAIFTNVVQYGDFDDVFTENGDERDNAAGGAIVTDLGFNFHPTVSDEFQITLSYAVGNGINSLQAFTLAPYADSLEGDLRNINGRNRDTLLESWYKRTFNFGGDSSLGATIGIIDATTYVDDNSFANDETTQFMNDIFVNSTLSNLPSYDGGGAFAFKANKWQLRAVIMNSKNLLDQNYMYYAAQLGYTLEGDQGAGNYRVYGFMTSVDFVDAVQLDEYQRLQGLGISADQQVTEHFGLFARLGWQDDAAAVDHNQLYSGGVNINGGIWGRSEDEIGIGYAYLKGAEGSGLEKTQAFEAYIKIKFLAYADFTTDIQYISDKGSIKNSVSPEGRIIGVRFNAYF